MRSSLSVLTFTVYATSALAWVADLFACIEPEAYCCAMLTTSGIGTNCLPASLQYFTQWAQVNTTTGEPSPSEKGQEYVSVCYRYPDDHDRVAACCKSNPTETTPNMKTFDCMSPEEFLLQYDSGSDEDVTDNSFTNTGIDVPGFDEDEDEDKDKDD